MTDEGNLDFFTELENLINRCSRENDSDTPDFILADFIRNSLIAWTNATRLRDKWYGYNPWNGQKELTK